MAAAAIVMVRILCGKTAERISKFLHEIRHVAADILNAPVASILIAKGRTFARRPGAFFNARKATQRN